METFTTSLVIEERRLLQNLARELRRRSLEALLESRTEHASTSESDRPDGLQPVAERS
jgi:hypothetical protein